MPLSASDHGAHLLRDASDAAPQPSVDALRALVRVDRALAPEHADLEGRVRGGRLVASASRSSDDLRLPPPPWLARGPDEIMAATTRAIAAFKAQAGQPVVAAESQLVAESRMMAVLDGIDRLKLQIQIRVDRELVD